MSQLESCVQTQVSPSIYETISTAIKLTKPTISLLVVITTLPSIFIAANGFPSLVLVFAALVGSGLASASAAAFNQIIEAKLDSSMQRTQERVLPSGTIERNQAVMFAAILGGVGFSLLYFYASPMAMYVAICGHLYYVVFYTIILKPLTPQNIVIGGAGGSIGPLIGWSAVSGDLPLGAWLLFLIIFIWTPPHFWSLALHYKKDYEKANIPMYPVVYGDAETKKMIFIYTLLLIPLVFLCYLFELGGLIFLSTSLYLSIKFAVKAFNLLKSKDNSLSPSLFHFSCFYALSVFASLTVDVLVRLWVA